FDAARQSPVLEMVMEPAHTFDVDGAVVHPDTLNQVGHAGCPLDAKDRLVDQIEYVAHRLKVLSLSVARGAHSAQVARIRMVGKLFDPVRSGLCDVREHMAQCGDVAVNRLACDGVL